MKFLATTTALDRAIGRRGERGRHAPVKGHYLRFTLTGDDRREANRRSRHVARAALLRLPIPTLQDLEEEALQECCNQAADRDWQEYWGHESPERRYWREYLEAR